MAEKFMIGKHPVGGDAPCFIIAEIGINHNGDLGVAKRLIDAAAEAGCDAVKLQSFKVNRLFNRKAGMVRFNNKYYSIYDVNKKFELPLEWVPELQRYAAKKGLELFSSVCDEQSANALHRLGMSAYKLPSSAITHLPLQEHVAKFGKPVIFSTGASDIGEVNDAYKTIRAQNSQVAMLHCIVSYPHELSDCNMEVIVTLHRCFPDAIIGWSDHTKDPVAAPVAAVVLGAKIVEKHITLDKKMPGPDHFFALEPHELKVMVRAIRRTEATIRRGERVAVPCVIRGKGEKRVYPCEQYSKRFSNQSIFAVRDLKRGERLSASKIRVLRPGNKEPGLQPKFYHILIRGYQLVRDVAADEPITWDCLLSR